VTRAGRVGWVGWVSGPGRHGRGEPGPRPFQPLLADRCQLLATFPQIERLLQGQAARFQPLDYLGELVTGLLVGDRSRLPGRPAGWLRLARPRARAALPILATHGINVAGQDGLSGLLGASG
jgi:hypothetical protein